VRCALPGLSRLPRGPAALSEALPLLRGGFASPELPVSACGARAGRSGPLRPGPAGRAGRVGPSCRAGRSWRAGRSGRAPGWPGAPACEPASAGRPRGRVSLPSPALPPPRGLSEGPPGRRPAGAPLGCKCGWPGRCRSRRSPKSERSRPPASCVVTVSVTGRSISSIRLGSAGAGPRGGSTETTVMPSMSNSASARTTSPAFAPG
jgi:hypothetical protein